MKLTDEKFAQVKELVEREIPYDPLYLWAWHEEAKGVLLSILLVLTLEAKHEELKARDDAAV